MCGIVGYVGKRNAQDVLLDGLEKLEYRGYDSAGVALALDGGIRVVKSKGRLTALREKLAAQQLAQSFCGIGHTRWATHGEPSDVNSHPHSTPRVSIVHNGIIENYGLLKERLAAKGYTFQSETDTEVLVKLIDSCYTGDPLRALQQALANDLLCPFHYFGISGLSVNDKDYETKDFSKLASDDRVEHILKQSAYYGYSGVRLKALVFCSSNEEARLLSEKFNSRGLRTVHLSGSDSQSTREDTCRRLALDEGDVALDYVFSVDIFNEGIDIPEVNQVILLLSLIHI